MKSKIIIEVEGDYLLSPSVVHELVEKVQQIVRDTEVAGHKTDRVKILFLTKRYEDDDHMFGVTTHGHDSTYSGGGITEG